MPILGHGIDIVETSRIRKLVEEHLHKLGVAATARLDPLIPGLTDTPQNLEPLLSALHDAGVVAVAASYLFLRPAFARRLPSPTEQLSCPPRAPSDIEH